MNRRIKVRIGIRLLPFREQERAESGPGDDHDCMCYYHRVNTGRSISTFYI